MLNLNSPFARTAFAWACRPRLGNRKRFALYDDPGASKSHKHRAHDATVRNEIKVKSEERMPKNYGYLPKGDRYKTLHCRKLTHEQGQKLYIVVKKKKWRIGIRVPLSILHEVHAKAKQTLAARRAATAQRDATRIAKAAAELDVHFPKIPAAAREKVLRHGFKKQSGSVRRTRLPPLPRRVFLAVSACIRHNHTDYKALSKMEKGRKTARAIARKEIKAVMQSWGYVEDAKQAPSEGST